MSVQRFTGTLVGDQGGRLVVRDAELVLADVPPVDPPPAGPDPEVPVAVRIGVWVWPVAGVDVDRLTDELVIYRPSDDQVVTPTNEWGAEAVVTGGVVRSLRDRVPRRETDGTPIPAGGWVLSGHGRARDWLMAHAQPGAVVGFADEAPPVTPPPAPEVGDLPWFGGSERAAADGSWAAQLASRTVKVGGTWADNSPDNQVAMWDVGPGGKWATWRKPLDLAVGAIFKDRGETWAAARAGAYDARWRKAIGNLRARWGDRPADLLWVSFARECNGGTWQKHWWVEPGERADYVTCFRRFTDMLRDQLPGVHVVWSLNDGTGVGFDWRTAYPGGDYVDVVGVDTYNSWPHIRTRAEFDAKIVKVDGHGGPAGIEAWRRYAESLGKPLCFPEWGQNGDPKAAGGGGDSPVYIEAMHEWMTRHAGSGPGKLLYAVYFNQWDIHQLWPSTMAPRSWDAYRSLF